MVALNSIIALKPARQRYKQEGASSHQCHQITLLFCSLQLYFLLQPTALKLYNPLLALLLFPYLVDQTLTVKMRRIAVTLMMVVFVCQIVVFIYRCSSFYHLKKKTFPSMVGLSTIATSILFTAVAGTLVFFTESGIHEVCQAASLVCIYLYMATKGQLYIFFIERMHIVHKKPSQTRMESPLYIFNMCLLIPFTALFVLMDFYRVADVGDDQHCRHGLRRESTIPGLIYDTLFSVYSVAVFVWPLFKSQSLRRSEALRWVVKKNIIGSVVSTVSTFMNVFSLYYEEVQDTNFCLLRCTVDVMVNVLVMNYLISGSGNKSGQNQSTYTSSYHHNKAVAVAHHDGHSESEEVSNNPTKTYPVKGSGGFSHEEDVAEITRTSTVLMTSDSEYILTSSKQNVVVEELV